MNNTINTVEDLLDIINHYPQWRQQIRQALFPEVDLPKALQRLADTQNRTDERLQELQKQIAEYRAEGEKWRAEAERQFAKIAEAQARFDERQQSFDERLQSFEKRLDSFEARVDKRFQKVDDRLGRLEGWQFEHRYREKAPAIFGSFLRKTKVVPLTNLEDELSEALTEDEFIELLNLDLLVRGLPRRQKGGSHVWLAVEVSVTVDRRDVERAIRRAELLRKANLEALPVVGGEEVTEGGLEAAQNHSVILVQNGSILHTEAAFQSVATD